MKNMQKQLSSAATIALKDALSAIYWYKSNLRSFLQGAISNKEILNFLNWDNYKRQIISDLVDMMCKNREKYLEDLLKLCHEVSNINSFKHLEILDGGQRKVEQAKSAVLHLRALFNSYQEFIDEQKKIEESRNLAAKKLKENNAVREKLKEMNSVYTNLVLSLSPAKRGFELEKLMYDLFNLFDLDPKASFRNLGEQIDGAFNLDGTDFLFEAKWQNEPIAIGDLDAFSAKVNRKLENTLGLFLSMSGYSQDAVLAHSKSRPSIILMDGADLMAIFEERINFVVLLRRKKTHAARTGDIYLPLPTFV